MGKSETARLFAPHGVPVYDADAAVHRLYGGGGARSRRSKRRFPAPRRTARSTAPRCRKRVTGDPEALERLEALVHPLVADERRQFLEDAPKRGADIVVFDIPLLFETGGEGNMDAVVVVSAPAHVQRERVLARPGMTRGKIRAPAWPARCPTRKSVQKPISWL